MYSFLFKFFSVWYSYVGCHDDFFASKVYVRGVYVHVSLVFVDGGALKEFGHVGYGGVSVQGKLSFDEPAELKAIIAAAPGVS